MSILYWNYAWLIIIKWILEKKEKKYTIEKKLGKKYITYRKI